MFRLMKIFRKPWYAIILLLICIGTDPLSADTDGDGDDDRWEIAFGFDPPGPRKGSKRVKTHFEPTPAPVAQPETPQA